MEEEDRGSNHDTQEALFEKLETYLWSQDNEFQSGLAAILEPNAPGTFDAQLEDLVLRARTFYYGRKFNVNVDYTAYKVWRERAHCSFMAPILPEIDHSEKKTVTDKVSSASSPDSASQPSGLLELGDQEPQNHNTQSTESSVVPQYPPSFQDIVELIQSGKPVPGILKIPDTVLVGQGTQAKQDKRRKPWEKHHVS